MDYDDDYGYGGVQLSLTRASEDGNYLNPSKLYYNMYLDDEKYTFYPDEYPELTDDLTDVPYSYSGTDLVSYGDNHIVYFYTTGFNILGIMRKRRSFYTLLMAALLGVAALPAKVDKWRSGLCGTTSLFLLVDRNVMCILDLTDDNDAMEASNAIYVS